MLAFEGTVFDFISPVVHSVSAVDKIGLSDISIKPNWSLRLKPGRDTVRCTIIVKLHTRNIACFYIEVYTIVF